MSGTKFSESLNSAYLVKCRSTKRKYAEKGGFQGMLYFVRILKLRGEALSNLENLIPFLAMSSFN